MKWTIELLESHNILRINTSGVFTLESQKAMFEDIAGHPDWRPTMPLMFDNRFIDMNRSDADTIRQSVVVLQNFCRLKSKGKIAGIVDRTNVNFGFGRQFETMAEFDAEADFRLFVDEEAAIEWLAPAVG